MKNSFFVLSFLLILVAGFLIRVIPTRENNFYFTMDQGDDAVHVREILTRHKILLHGPETGIKGIYHGVGWYYFIAIGYWLFNGHPFGAVFMMILLNLVLTAILMVKLARRVSPRLGLLVGFSLQFFWWFYDASLYAFNPFPAIFLSFWAILGLIEFLNYKNKSAYLVAAIPVGLTYHGEIAFAVPLTIFFITVGIWTILHRFITLRLFVVTMFLLSIFWLPRALFELQTGFSQTYALRNEIKNPQGIFSGTNVILMTRKYVEMIGKTVLPSNRHLGFFFYLFISGLFLAGGYSSKNLWRRRFIQLMLALIFISWITFGSNLGWRAWHTTSIPVLVFVSIILMISTFPKKFAVPFLVLILIAQLLLFVKRYNLNFYPSNDASILKNEIGAIDWVYEKSRGRGFYVYNYLPSVLDYPYQYLFWWYGRNKYGYVPCEYSSFPGSPGLFVPGKDYYQEPKRDCDRRFLFLIIEPDKNLFVRLTWLDEVTKNTRLIEEGSVGTIQVQKREVLDR